MKRKVTPTAARIYLGLTHGLILQGPEESCEPCQSGAHGICKEYGHVGNFPCRCLAAMHPNMDPFLLRDSRQARRSLLFGTDASHPALQDLFHVHSIHCDGDVNCPLQRALWAEAANSELVLT